MLTGVAFPVPSCCSTVSGADVLWLGLVDRSPNRQPVKGFDWPESSAAEAIQIAG